MALRPSCLLPALAVALWASPGAATISAEDAWAATEAYWEAFGLEIDATLRREGETLNAVGISATALLPFGAGALAVTAPDLLMIEPGDGTVRIEVRSPATIAFDLRLSGGEAVRFPLTFAWTDREQVASGSPGDVTFTLRTGRVDLSLGEVVATSLGKGGTPAVEVDISLASTEIATRITLGEMTTIASTAGLGAMIYGYAITAGPATRMQAVGRAEPSTGEVLLSLPPSGPDLLNLGEALRAGMTVSIDSRTGGNLAQTVTTSAGAVVSQDTQTTGEGRQNLRIDATGLAHSGEFRDLSFAMEDGYNILEVEGDLAAASWEASLPFIASEARQPFSLAMAFDELRLSPRTWAMVDAGGALPRDPLSLDIAMGGDVTLPFDLVDPAGWKAAALSPDLSFDLNSFAVERFKAQGLGVLADGHGAFTFDNADRTTFPGFPRPEGLASLTVQGVQALIDRMREAGLLTPQEARDARLAMAFAFRAEGPDRSSSALEVTPEGRVLLNGQPVR